MSCGVWAPADEDTVVSDIELAFLSLMQQSEGYPPGGPGHLLQEAFRPGNLPFRATDVWLSFKLGFPHELS